MDPFALDYYLDPRNAGFTPRRPFGFLPAPAQFAQQGQTTQPVKAPIRTLPQQVPPMAFNPYAYGYGYPPVGYGAPASRRMLRDITLGELLPLVAVGVTALRTLPEAPTDARDTAVNVVNQTKFMAAVARHFQSDARLNAIGAIVGGLIR